VLFDPILTDTGWSEPALASAFSLSILIGGVGSLAGGWLLDRFGSRVVFVLAAAVTLTTFQIAAGATELATFATAGAIGGGTIGALAFYHVTQTTAVRISGPGSTDRAIAVLTIWGAFASAIYMPIAALLVGPLGWRLTLRILTLSAGIALLVGAIAVTTKTSGMPATRNVLVELRASLEEWAARRFVIAQGLAGIGIATLLVYQVPAMTAAGLPLAAASFWAGARGFSQLFGRLPLMPIVRRWGVLGSLRIAYLATSVGILVLAFAGNPWLAAVYAALAGFGIGATSPLVGMYSSEVFGAKSLGTSMGLMGMVFLVVGSIGPAAAGFIAEATESRVIPVAGAAVMTMLAALVIRPTRLP
jgi:MFS family permease